MKFGKGSIVRTTLFYQRTHDKLRRLLKEMVRDRNAVTNEYPWFDEKGSVVFFQFLRTNVANGIAAQVLSYVTTSKPQ